MKICKSCCGSTTLTVTGCLNFTTPLPLPGASVSIVQASVTIFSGTTNSLGKATFAAAAGVSCSYTITYTGLTTKTGSFTPTSGAFTTSVGLTPATAGYRCTSCCPNPLPLTLNGTTPIGPLALTFGTIVWFGCQTAPVGTVNSSCAASSGDAAFGLQLGSTCTPGMLSNQSCCGPTGTPTVYTVSACPTGPVGTGLVVSVQCSPLVVTYTVPPTLFATFGAAICTAVANPLAGTSTFTP